MKSRNYINNKTLYEHMIKHREQVLKNKEEGNIKPQASEYIGSCIYLICTKLSNKPNFSGYSYKSEMIGDALIDCVSAIDNFDPTKTTNPFAYFTQITWNAYIRRIFKEKKQNYIKHKNFQNMSFSDGYITGSMLDDEKSNEVIRSFENNLTKEKKKVIVGVEKFIGENNNVK